jgi:hypothetical protein
LKKEQEEKWEKREETTSFFLSERRGEKGDIVDTERRGKERTGVERAGN